MVDNIFNLLINKAKINSNIKGMVILSKEERRSIYKGCFFFFYNKKY